MKNVLSMYVRDYGGRFAISILILSSVAQAHPGEVQGHIGSIKGKPVYHETEFHGAFATFTLKNPEPLVKVKSPFQKIEVFATEAFGNMLVNDGIVMLTQFDNHAYHEMIAHVPLFAHPNPKRVLIVGGGDGGTLTEVLKHDGVEEVIMCEIDKKVVDVSKKYFPELTQSFKDPRATVVYEDAAKYVKNKKDYYDIIIVDSSDPIGPAVVLFQKQFYQDVKDALKKMVLR